MTHIISTGFNTGNADGDLNHLAKRLDHMLDLGCTGAELSVVGLDVVASCRLVTDRVKQLAEITASRDLAYSMHAPIAINLMDEDHAKLMQDAAIVSMELAAEVGAKVVVLHPGRCHPVDWTHRSKELLDFELEQIKPVADRAEALGVQIGYENISPNARVIDGEETSYSLDPRQLANQLAQLDHPAVMACLDISHAQQGSVLWNFDMLEACEALAPWINHIHFSDSTGIPATFPTGSKTEQQFFGAGDMHAPQGFGAVDFETLAERLPLRAGTRIVIELKKNFLAHAEAQTLADAKAFAARVNETLANEAAE